MGLEVQTLNPPPCKEKKTRFPPLAVISFSAAADLMEQVAIQILFFAVPTTNVTKLVLAKLPRFM